jgi:hypothetical protein
MVVTIKNEDTQLKCVRVSLTTGLIKNLQPASLVYVSYVGGKVCYVDLGFRYIFISKYRTKGQKHFIDI